MKIIDNKIETLGDNLKQSIHKNADLEVCASIFSMYGYKYLNIPPYEVLENSFISFGGIITKGCRRFSRKIL